MEKEIKNEKKVKWWMGDKMRNIIKKKDWDRIWIEEKGMKNGKKILNELDVKRIKKDNDVLEKKSD